MTKQPMKEIFHNPMKEIFDNSVPIEVIITKGIEISKKLVKENQYLDMLINYIDKEIEINKVKGRLSVLKANSENYKLSLTILTEDGKYENIRITDEFGNASFLIDNDIIKNKDFATVDYVLLNAVIQRMKHESTYLGAQIKKMEASGLVTKKISDSSYEYTKQEKQNKIVNCFQIEVDFYDEFEDSKKDIAIDQINYDYCVSIRNLIIYKYNMIFNFISRCCEMHINETIDLSDWEAGFKLPKKRIEWFKKSYPKLECDIRLRRYEKTI